LGKLERRLIRAFIFDLDGVVVDTAKLHFDAWKRLASEIGIDFSEKDNERLKGVSRMKSMEILLEIGGMNFSRATVAQLAEQKNQWYVELVDNMNEGDILPGVVDFIEELSSLRIKTAIASASKNACLVLKQIGLKEAFDVVVDGTMTRHAKPDPEIFLLSSGKLQVPPELCIVFEDAIAGIEAAHQAGMIAVGVGNEGDLESADATINGFEGLNTRVLSLILAEKRHIDVGLWKEGDDAQKKTYR